MIEAVGRLIDMIANFILAFLFAETAIGFFILLFLAIWMFREFHRDEREFEEQEKQHNSTGRFYFDR